ncbi:hypothetical protein [uncultured Desulfovibrio sp.]|uniref:hypothetical protein n=1 Tax=uncultured Desulfovibrio sp. TaxID=167968 RepID=UPI001AAC3CD7|nr:hypothetical protein [uncultured Desulfovibrio sp.]CAI3223054.1 hypothetical protein DWUX_511 [Desulfovibrio diazotrophicus]VVU42803.1 hypothetical protein DWUX_149 [Desulfovibrio diazotrophicus]
MGRVRQWFVSWWRAFCIRRKYGAAISPAAIAAQALELAAWAEEAGRGALFSEAELRRVARAAAGRPFRRLPPQRRLDLHMRLSATRANLLATLGQARLMTEKRQ